MSELVRFQLMSLLLYIIESRMSTGCPYFIWCLKTNCAHLVNCSLSSIKVLPTTAHASSVVTAQSDSTHQLYSLPVGLCLLPQICILHGLPNVFLLCPISHTLCYTLSAYRPSILCYNMYTLSAYRPSLLCYNIHSCIYRGHAMKRWHRLQVCACCHADQLQQTWCSPDTLKLRAIIIGKFTRVIFVALLVELADAIEVS